MIFVYFISHKETKATPTARLIVLFFQIILFQTKRLKNTWVKVVQVYTQTITSIAQLMTILNSIKDSIRIINKEKFFHHLLLIPFATTTQQKKLNFYCSAY